MLLIITPALISMLQPYVHLIPYSRLPCLSQIRYSLVVILELNDVSEVQYKDVMMIDDGKYQ